MSLRLQLPICSVSLLLLWCAPHVAAAERAPTPTTSVASLGVLELRIREGEFAGTHSLMVVQHSKTIAEWYFEGQDETILNPLGFVKFTPDTLHDVRSVTKSVVSMLVGIAVSEGAIKDLDAPVLDYFPEYKDLQTDARRTITIRDMLSMTSGLHWSELTIPYTDPRNSAVAMYRAKDPYLYTLSQAIDTPAGDRWNYSGGDVAVVAAILTRAVKMPLETYAQLKIFGPMNIRFEWSRVQGIALADAGLRLTPRDMAKLGVMMQNGGRWQGKQVVPKSWVALATSPHARVGRDSACGQKYGYFVWLGPGCETTPHAPWFAGIGNGGQRIWVVPGRDLVIVSTAGLYNSPTQVTVASGLLKEVLSAVPDSP